MSLAKDDLQPETLDGPSYPKETASDISPLNLVNPDDTLSGTQRGVQYVGSPNLQIDNATGLVIIKDSAIASTKVLGLGPVSTNFLGLAVNDGTNDNLFIGKDSSGNTVIKVAKSGFDAKTASNSNLIFNSSQDIFKIVQTGTTTLSPPNSWTAGTTVTATVSHGLGFSPAFMAFVQIPNIPIYVGAGAGNLTSMPNLLAISGSTGISTIARVDTNNIYFDLTNVGPGTDTGLDVYTWSYKFYILQETAN